MCTSFGEECSIAIVVKETRAPTQQMRAEIQRVGPNDVCVAIQQILITDYHAAVQQVMPSCNKWVSVGV